jgi:multidrug resistance efflux pump
VLPQNRDRLTGAEADFAIAVHELRQVTGSLREWQSDAESGVNRLDDLQRSLNRIMEVDERITAARQQRDIRLTDWKSIDDEYARGLREAIETVQALATQLDGERSRLAPKLDAGVKQREVRSAYARALTQQ